MPPFKFSGRKKGNNSSIPLQIPVLALTVNSSSQITADWTAVPNGNQYELQRATDVNFTQNVVTLYVGTGVQYINSSLNASTTYYYRVRALGYSNYSTSGYDVESATTLAGTTTTTTTVASTTTTTSSTTTTTTTISNTPTSISTYPTYSSTKPLGSPASPGDTFAFDAAGSPATNSPNWGEYIKYGSENDTIPLYGELFTTGSGTDTEVKLWDGTTLHICSIPSTSNGNAIEATKMAFRIPSSFGSFKFGIAWVKNNNGWGKPFTVNGAQITWIEDKEVQGTRAMIFGRNLSRTDNDWVTADGGQAPAHVWFKDTTNGTFIECTVTRVEPYRIDYIVPTGLTNGREYEVYVHPRTGGDWNWTKSPVNFKPWVGIGNGGYTAGTITPSLLAGAENATANTTAINNAIASAGSGSGYKVVSIPSGTWYINSHLVPYSRVKIKGAGGNARNNTLTSKILFAAGSNFTTRFMQAGSNEEFMIEDLEINTNGNYPSQHLFHLRDGNHFHLKNVRIMAKYDNGTSTTVYTNIPLMDTHQKTYLRFEDCFFAAGQMDFVTARKGRIERCEWRSVNSVVACMYPWSMANYAIIDCVNGDLNSNDIQECGRGRFLTLSGAYSASRNIYVGHCVGDNVGPHKDFTDKNQGEWVMAEGSKCRMERKPVSVGSDWVEFSSATPDIWAPNYDIYHLVVLTGKGQMQVMEIDNVRTPQTGPRIYLKKPWEVIPDTDSVIQMHAGVHELIAYNCRTTYKSYIRQELVQVASGGVQPFGACSFWLARKCTFDGNYTGMFNFPTAHTEIGYRTVDPNMWIEWYDNTCINNVRGYSAYIAKPDAHIGGKAFVDVQRRNGFSGSAYGDIVVQASSNNLGYDVPVMEYLIVEHCQGVTPAKNIEASGSPNVSSALVHKQIYNNNGLA